MRLIVFAAPRGSPQHHPVRRPIACPAEPLRVDEGFQIIDRMPVDALPILRQVTRHAAQNVRGQMRYRDPRQYQKARVVGEITDVPPPRLPVPADETVPAGQMPRRRTPGQTCYWPPLGPYQIL